MSTALRVSIQILRLRRERVRFAVELLHQEVEAPARRLVAADHAAHLGDVTAEALELLVHVEALQQDRKLLLEALVIDLGDELGDPLVEA